MCVFFINYSKEDQSANFSNIFEFKDLRVTLIKKPLKSAKINRMQLNSTPDHQGTTRTKILLL
jgi:hypothetical protein